MVSMRKASVCAGRAYKKQKLAVQQASPLRTRRTIQTEQPKTAKVEAATKKLADQQEGQRIKAVQVQTKRVIANGQTSPQIATDIGRFLPTSGKGSSYIPVTDQNKIVRLYLEEGRSISWISRELHRDRETVNRIVHAPAVQAALDSAQRRLLGYVHNWIDSINYAVDTEQDGALAFKLLERFGVIPGPAPNVIGAGQAAQPGQTGYVPPINEEQIFQDMKKACAYEIGRVAMERHDVYGSSLPIELEELEAMVKQRQEKKASQREQKKEN